MNVHLHIDRLVLDGLPLSARENRAVRAALQQELAHLLSSMPAEHLLRIASVSRLSAPSIDLRPGMHGAEIGRSIAGSLQRGLMPVREGGERK